MIEWFYVDGHELFIMAGDFLLKVRPDFDRDRGARHNMKDNDLLTWAFSQAKQFQTNWRQWWVDALLFDALIGNTDRHQANGSRLAPLFDSRAIRTFSLSWFEHKDGALSNRVDWRLED